MVRGMRKAAPDGEPKLFPGFNYERAKRHFRRICKAAAIKQKRLHDLRHRFASQTLSAGFTLSDVGALLGHTTAQTTMRYAHLLPNRLRAATEAAGEALAPKWQG
jgi:integrase